MILYTVSNPSPSPIFCALSDECDERPFRVHVRPFLNCQLYFPLRVRGAVVVIVSKPVTNQQMPTLSVTSINATVHAYVPTPHPTMTGLAHPQFDSICQTARLILFLVLDICSTEVDIDDGLRGQSWYGCGADVINANCGRPPGPL